MSRDIFLPIANEVRGKVISLQASVCSRGGGAVPDQVNPLGSDTTLDQTPPPGPDYPPQTRHPILDQTPPRPDTPRD